MSKKKKRRHRLGGPSPQNVALGQRELIVRTVAQDPNVQLRINPAGVAKMSDVLLRFAEPILDRLAPLDEKKATLLFAITAWNYCLISSEEQAHMRWELRHIFNNLSDLLSDLLSVITRLSILVCLRQRLSQMPWV